MKHFNKWTRKRRVLGGWVYHINERYSLLLCVSPYSGKHTAYLHDCKVPIHDPWDSRLYLGTISSSKSLAERKLAAEDLFNQFTDEIFTFGLKVEGTPDKKEEEETEPAVREHEEYNLPDPPTDEEYCEGSF